jgi:penicillin-binding protein 1C
MLKSKDSFSGLLSRKKLVAPAIILLIIILVAVLLPLRLFRDPCATVIEDRNGLLIGARIAADGQWRFPEIDSVPEKYATAVICFEDRNFYRHPGINPVSIIRAIKQNITAGRTISGGSTITMQLARLSLHAKKRSIWNKFREMLLAVRIELHYSKNSILRLYASHSPFGGNVVGVDAASWRYFGKSPESLSWAEAATLAVLPNSPALIHPGRNRSNLEIKRNKLLDKLLQRGKIDNQTCDLAKAEPLPDKPHPLPQEAPHLLDRVWKSHKGQRIRTTIDHAIQDNLRRIITWHMEYLKSNHIYNAAAIVVDVKSGQVIAYQGNTWSTGERSQGNDVDVIIAPRSTGSILKPILFAAMLEDGILLPGSLVADIPTRIGGFAPQNYNQLYDGAVPARKALSRSLNVPAVKMLQSYGVDRFYHQLKSYGMTTLRFPADHYGLSLILGGAEGSLWDLCSIYTGYARILNHYNQSRRYYANDLRPLGYIVGNGKETVAKSAEPIIGAGALWLTFDALLEVNRPDEESGWEMFASSRKIAWKTGTSFGFRDAWSIGTTPEYVVGVWVGNASGEGRPGLTGAGSAAPIMFDIFNSLPATTWFAKPYEDLEKIPVCRQSGYRCGPDCPDTDTIYVQLKGLRTAVCPYHKLIHLDKSGQYRVNAGCEDVANIQNVPWFILPPAMEWFFRNRNPFYKPIPPLKPGCVEESSVPVMEFVFPRDAERIFVPRELNGKTGKVVFEVAHRNPKARIFWHLDDVYITETQSPHQVSFNPEPGFHRITLVDKEGNRISRRFEIASK